MGQRLPLAYSSNRSRPAGPQTCLASNKDVNPVSFAIWPYATQEGFLQELPSAFTASQLPFQNAARSATGRTKTHNNPGFSDNICFLLQLRCHCLDFHKHSAVWDVPQQKGTSHPENTVLSVSTAATGALTPPSWKSTGQGSRPGPCFTEAS